MSTDVHALLQSYHFSILKDMATLLGLNIDSPRKAHYERALQPILFKPETITKGLSLLSDREREVLAHLHQQGGRVDVKRFKRRLIQLGVVAAAPEQRRGRYGYDYYSYYGYRGNPLSAERKYFEDVIARLMALGLVVGRGVVYTNRTKIHYDNVATLEIPEEVKPYLTSLPSVSEELTLPPLDRVAESSARTFQRNLYLYWSVAREHPLAVTREGRLYKRDFKRISNTLLQSSGIVAHGSEVDSPQFLFLRLLAMELGLLTVTPGGEVRAAEHPHFLTMGAGERVRRSFEVYRDGHFWNELLSVPRIFVLGLTRFKAAHEQIVKARQTVIAHLRNQPAHDWVPIRQVINAVYLSDYDFLFPRNFVEHNRDHLGLLYGYMYQAYRSPYTYANPMQYNVQVPVRDEAEAWEIVEAGFIRAVICEPLFWMGLVDLGYVNDEPVAYRLTPIGAWVLGIGPAVELPDTEEGRVIVQPNFEILALDPISDVTLIKLDEFCERISAERVVQYRLTRESVYRGQQAGWTADKIIAFLQRVSTTPIPQNVLRSLEEWQRIHERIVVRRQVGVVQAAHPELMDAMMERPEFRTHVMSRPAPTAALIAPEKQTIAKITQALSEAGYPPAHTVKDQDALHPCLTLDDQGTIQFTDPLPSIFVFKRLRRFAEEDNGTFRITEQSIQAALSDGMTVSQILEELEKLHRGPIPRWAQIAVRAWGHYYGDAALQTVTLLQVKDRQTLEELQSDPELRSLIRPFTPSQDKALAVVTTDDLDRLRELLRQRGMKIEDELA